MLKQWANSVVGHTAARRVHCSPVSRWARHGFKRRNHDFARNRGAGDTSRQSYTVRRPSPGARRARTRGRCVSCVVCSFFGVDELSCAVNLSCRADLAPEHSPVASRAGCLTAGTASCASRSASSAARQNALIQRITLASDAVVQAASAAVAPRLLPCLLVSYRALARGIS